MALAPGAALGSPFVNMSSEEALLLVRAHFGLTATATRFATEKDDTFRIDTTDRRSFVFKVASPSEDPTEIALQCALMQHVSVANPRIPVPHLVPNVAGQAHFSITDAAGQQRQARLMTFLRGTPLDSTHSSSGERERVGEVLARLRLATATFSHPADDRVLPWDVRHLAGLRPLLDNVTNPRQRDQLAAGLERFNICGTRIAALRRQVLHNDFSRSNIVVDHGRAEFVTGIIDFGDAVRTAVAIDVSTALLNQLLSEGSGEPGGDIFLHARDVLRGYLRIADLTHEELQLIPHLTMGRVVARALLTLWRAQLFPENATYILRNTARGWSQLDWFLSRSPAEVSETLLCEPAPAGTGRSPTAASRNSP
jgi:Ser/Thr protein kinase RdoA (MazF antagonist)